MAPMRSASTARSNVSVVSATSASTVRPSAETSAKPPSTTIRWLPPAVCTVRMPGRKVVTKGAWPSSTPKSPSAPGTSTCCTSPENTSFSGETSSKCNAIDKVPASAPAFGRETETQADNAADQADQRDVAHLARGEGAAAARNIVPGHLKLQWPQLDLGRFRPREIAGEGADQQPDHQKGDEV